MKQKIILILVTVLCIALLGACAGNTNTPANANAAADFDTRLVGTWDCTDTINPHIWLCFLEITEYGRFTDGDGDTGGVITQGDQLTLLFDEFEAFTVTYNISFNILTLTVDGTSITLSRR